MKLLEAVVREVEIGVLVIDSEENILFMNPFFKDSFLMKETESVNKVADIISDHALLEAIEKTLQSKDNNPEKVTLEGKNGEILEVRLVHFVEESIRGLIGFFHDITEEKRVEAIKRDFVANVSHELRTPLASIKGYAETLLDGAMDDMETLKNFLSVIDKHANRMTALIDDLLILSKLESQQMPLKLEEVDITWLIQSAIHGLEKNAKDKGVKLIGDVEDTGTGIPEKDQSRIFERFYRVDKGRSRDLGGTGLGLAIVKHIIQAHNGRIWVQSLPGKGTTFTFTIPERSC